MVLALSLKNGDVFRNPHPPFLDTAGLFNWYWCFHLQQSRELVSPVGGIFFYEYNLVEHADKSCY